MTRITSRTIGDFDVTILTDGGIDFGPELFPGTAQAHIDAILAAHNAQGIATNFNAVLIRGAGRTVLCDAGPRDLFGPACGFLPDALAESGTAPEQIDTLFATHMHPDHIAGMITPDGKAVFANAELAVPQAELDFWGDEARTAPLPDSVQDWARLARAVLKAYGERLRPIAPRGEIAPGLTAMPLAGHTPGHSGWRLSSGTEQLIHVGDLMHAPVLQAADPDIAIAFDMDADTARTTRKHLLDELASDGALFTGGHLLQPAFRLARRAGSGYRLEQP